VKVLKLVALILACTTLVFIIIVGVMGVTGINAVIYAADMTFLYPLTEKLQMFGVNIDNSHDVIIFIQTMHDEIFWQTFMLGNATIIKYITVFVLACISSLSTVILTVILLMQGRDKGKDANKVSGTGCE